MSLGLSRKDVAEYCENLPPSLNKLFLAMEQKETWVLDNRKDIERRFELEISNVTPESLLRVANEDPHQFLKFMFLMSIQRFSMLLNILSEKNSSLFTELMYTSLEILETDVPEVEKRAARIFRDRMVAICQTQYASNLFDPKKRDILIECLEEVNKETGGLGIK